MSLNTAQDDDPSRLNNDNLKVLKEKLKNCNHSKKNVAIRRKSIKEKANLIEAQIQKIDKLIYELEQKNQAFKMKSNDIQYSMKIEKNNNRITKFTRVKIKRYITNALRNEPTYKQLCDKISFLSTTKEEKEERLKILNQYIDLLEVILDRYDEKIEQIGDYTIKIERGERLSTFDEKCMKKLFPDINSDSFPINMQEITPVLPKQFQKMRCN